MGALCASHHNFHRLCKELYLGCAEPWVARVTSGYATSEVLAISSRGHSDDASISGVICHRGDDIRAQLAQLRLSSLSSGSARSAQAQLTQLRSGIVSHLQVVGKRRRRSDVARTTQVDRYVDTPSLLRLPFLEVKLESTRILPEHQSSVFYDIVWSPSVLARNATLIS